MVISVFPQEKVLHYPKNHQIQLEDESGAAFVVSYYFMIW